MRTYSLIISFLLFCLSGHAQVTEPSRQPWYVPEHAVLQTAGGIGMIAGGVGYALGAHRRFDADVLIGYVPGTYTGDRAFGIFTLKGTYSPFTLPVDTHWQIKPLAIGALINYTPSQMLNRSRDDKYSYKNYYWWGSTVRLGAFLGGRVGYGFNTRTGRKRVASAYYELGTNDLYFVSLLTNTKGLALGQILTLGLGVKVDF
ncbi:hypothetical protein [Hymenobacter crusticola]|uniref:Outer membrane protein beta-barrel domain-containing protein n=1 Tax=Hymenobacter crusticola TaxID=1770526 RepID=A0A243WJX8_9BACT|nr:hypothetical protein [Hymenobacter crusticola]OUJ76202.1 hypothetical protein BXP70_02740 [Hymenobacter crusticola]